MGSMQLALETPSLMARLFTRGWRRPRVTRWFAGQVRAGATREIPHRAGRTIIHCREGEAWITHDGDPRDVVLRADQSYAVDNGGRMTLHALRADCVFEVQVES